MRNNHLELPPDYEPSVYIVDDDDSVRTSVADLINCMGFKTNLYESAEAFMEKTENNICGCVLTDLRLMGCNGIELIKYMHTIGYEIPVIVVSGYVDVTNTVNAMSEGALSVIKKPYPEQELWDSIIAAIKIDSEHRKARLWSQEIQEKIATLTDSEKEVMDLLLKGKSNKSIAHSLELSQRTIVMRRKAILDKLGVDHVIDLAKLNTKLQLIQRQLNFDNKNIPMINLADRTGM